MADSSRYWKGSIPNAMVDEVKEVMAAYSGMAYDSPTEFIKDAVRRRIEEIRRTHPLKEAYPTAEEIEKARLANRRAVERARAEDERRAREGR